MKILGIDTSTKFLSLGASDGAKIYEYNLDLGTKHSTLLMPTIKRALKALGWDVADIDYLACGLGPGSFTGIRVGLSTIKGLAWPLKKPVIGISTLDILAKSVKETGTYIVPAVDAKRNLIYCSIYKSRDNLLKRLSGYMLLAQDEFFKKVRPRSLILGDAAGIYKDIILKHTKGIKILDRDYWYPKGHCIIELAGERIKNKKFDNAFDIKPIYLYPKECQIRVKK